MTALLKSRVDLIWNGGIGTYVKSSSENNAEVGDRANDGLRVDGKALRCQVFGEGGNLGMTQRGRIEFCLKGGLCNTDFIDNAAGVDCSDHEVNVKILLNQLVVNGELSVDERNSFLVSMTDSVSELVLHNNVRQTQAISLALHRSDQQYAEYQRFMAWLESQGKLDRELEFLPTDDQLTDRLNRQQPVWTRPELAVLTCYSKVMLKEALLEADLLSDPVLARSVGRAFPPALVERYGTEVSEHQLRQEIASTQLANDLVDRVGFAFFFRQMEFTGGSAGDVIRAYTIVMGTLNINGLWEQIEQADLPAKVQLELLHILIRLARRTTRWVLRNRRLNINCTEMIEQFSQPMQDLLWHLPELHEAEWTNLWLAEKQVLSDLGVENQLAGRLAASDSMFMSMGIVDTALHLNQPIHQVAELNFKLGEYLSLDWFMAQIVDLQPHNRWQDLAREAYVDDLEGQRRRLSACLLKASTVADMGLLLSNWQAQHPQLIRRWKSMVKDLRHSGTPDFAMISVALRELLSLVQSSVDAALETDSVND